MTPRLSVIIPHYEDLANLDVCLTLLERQSMPRDRFEIIVADNRSPCGLAAVRDTVRGRATVVDAPEKGAGPTRNAAAALATGDVLAFIDSDCRPEPAWLAEGEAALAETGVAGGHVKVLVGDPRHLHPVEAFELVFAFNNEAYIRKGFSVSANLFVRRDVWTQVGGFRNAVSEDVDWCWRAREAGHPVVYAPRAEVGHPARRNWSELTRKWRRLTSETYLLRAGRPFAKLSWLARTWALLPSPLAHLPKIIRSGNLDRSTDRAKAAAVLIAIRLFRFVEGHRVMLRNG